jgi:hypothetical protein
MPLQLRKLQLQRHFCGYPFPRRRNKPPLQP